MSCQGYRAPTPSEREGLVFFPLAVVPSTKKKQMLDAKRAEKDRLRREAAERESHSRSF